MTTREVCTRVVVDPCPTCGGSGKESPQLDDEGTNGEPRFIEVLCLDCEGSGKQYTEQWVSIEALREELDALNPDPKGDDDA
jgi:hypothetical protein